MTILTSLLDFAAIATLATGPGWSPDPLIGAWSGQDSRDGRAIEVVVIFTAAHQVAVWFDPVDGEVVHTNGGLWSRSGTRVTEIVEFDSDNPGRVGSSVSFDVDLSDTELSIVGSDMRLTRVDGGDQGRLEGAWLLFERLEAGRWIASESSLRTVRLMSGERFQQVVYDPESGRLVSTLGGTYVTGRDELVETVEFRRSPPNAGGPQVRYSLRQDAGNWWQTSDGVGWAWRPRPQGGAVNRWIDPSEGPRATASTAKPGS